MCRAESSFKLIIHKSSFLKQNLGWQIPKLSYKILKPECCSVTYPTIDIQLRLLAQKKCQRKAQKPEEIHMGILRGQHRLCDRKTNTSSGLNEAKISLRKERCVNLSAPVTWLREKRENKRGSDSTGTALDRNETPRCSQLC